MIDDRHDDDARNGEVEETTSRPAPRNPFDESNVPDEKQALIDTRKSAAVSGVIVGLVALFFVVAICAMASIAFG